jgi:hypothetical protein
MENLLIGAFIFLAGLFSSSFLPSYMKKKGENLATKEDIQELARQTAILTQAAKEIEARISIGVWSQQQRWDVQKTALLESLKELATAEAFLSRLVYTFSDTTDHSEGWAERRKEANEKYADAMNNFWRTQLAMEIVCGRAIGNQFQEIENIFKRIRNSARQGHFDEIWDKQYPELLAAKRELGETIRRQLEFDPQLGGGELVLSSHITPQSHESSAAQGPD